MKFIMCIARGGRMMGVSPDFETACEGSDGGWDSPDSERLVNACHVPACLPVPWRKQGRESLAENLFCVNVRTM